MMAFSAFLAGIGLGMILASWALRGELADERLTRKRTVCRLDRAEALIACMLADPEEYERHRIEAFADGRL